VEGSKSFDDIGIRETGQKGKDREDVVKSSKLRKGGRRRPKVGGVQKKGGVNIKKLDSHEGQKRSENPQRRNLYSEENSG